MAWLNTGLYENIQDISVAAEVVQLVMLPLNPWLLANIHAKLVTLLTSQELSDWLKASASLNMLDMLVTLPVFQPPMF